MKKMTLTWQHHRSGNFPTKLWTLTLPESIPEWGQNTSQGTKSQMIRLAKKYKQKYGWEMEEKGMKNEATNTNMNGINLGDLSDDLPPSNIVFGEKYKKTEYDNRLTTFNLNYKPDTGDWYWDSFEKAAGMEDINNYSRTLQKMEVLFPREDWDGVWNRIKHVPADIVNARFDAQLKPHRTADNQIGREEDVKVDKYKSDIGKINYSDLISRLELFSK